MKHVIPQLRVDGPRRYRIKMASDDGSLSL